MENGWFFCCSNYVIKKSKKVQWSDRDFEAIGFISTGCGVTLSERKICFIEKITCEVCEKCLNIIFFSFDVMRNHFTKTEKLLLFKTFFFECNTFINEINIINEKILLMILMILLMLKSRIKSSK